MSRIRSIHPGLWTDEAFVSLSPMTRLFLLGLWNECDDMGSFAWSPLSLKMRILPADNADAPALLDEMIGAGIIMRYEVGGKTFGAVRNFCQYQRPKKPNSVHPQTDQVRQWVNTEARSTRDGSEPVGNQLPTEGEKLRQMEDGGCRKDSSVANATGAEPPSDPIKELFDVGVSILTAAGQSEKEARSMVGKWRKAKGEGEVLAALLDCRSRAISNPLEWLQKRFNGAKWVSASGYEYRGSDSDVLREAERRGDNSTYWSVKRAIDDRKPPAEKPPDRRRGTSTVGSATAKILRAAGG